MNFLVLKFADKFLATPAFSKTHAAAFLKSATVTKNTTWMSLCNFHCMKLMTASQYDTVTSY